jgi:hypothetical protein
LLGATGAGLEHEATFVVAPGRSVEGDRHGLAFLPDVQSPSARPGLPDDGDPELAADGGDEVALVEVGPGR